LPLFSSNPKNKLDRSKVGPGDKSNGVASPFTTVQEEQQLKDINRLVKEKEQRETAINRLKFQLNELKVTADESEKKRIDAEKKIEELTKGSEVARKKNKDLYDELKGQLSEEREDLKRKLRSASNELKEVKLISQQDLEKAQQDAEAEKKEMLTEIGNLQIALEQTNAMIAKAKTDMNTISNDSVVEIDRQRGEIIKKDEEIRKLVKVRNELENDINTLKLQCEKLKSALEESEEQALEVKVKMEELRGIWKADQDSMSYMKEEFSMEKRALSDKLESLTEKLNSSETELKITKSKSIEEKQELQVEMSHLQAKLNEANDKLERASRSVYEVRKAADDKVNRMKEDTDKYKSTMRSISSFEKNDMKRKVWDLEYKVEKAKYDLIRSEKQVKTLKATASSYEDKIKTLEEAYESEIFELEQNLRVKEMFYAKSKIASRQRMEGLAGKFQKRMKRRENTTIGNLEAAVQELSRLFDITVQSGTSRTIGQKRTDLFTAITDAAAKMEATKEDFNAKVAELENSLVGVQEKAKKDLIEKNVEFELKLKEEQQKAKAERDKLVTTKNDEIKKVEEEGRRSLSAVRMDLTEKLNDLKNEEKRLQDSLDKQNKLVQKYEEDQKSYRKLVKLAWKATREKISSRRKKKPKM